MSRPIASVHMDIARFVLEVSKISGDSAESTERLRGVWVTELMECLAMRDPSLHAYGAHLLTEVEAYRLAETERKNARIREKKNPRIPRKDWDSAESAESAESQPRTDRTDRAGSKTDPVQGEGSPTAGARSTRAGGAR
jgi:hypothetical protein